MPAPVRLTAPYYPIVYIRGYAMTQGEIEDTVATPYMGFNLGSVKNRQRFTGEIERHIFESPLIRLMKDENYSDSYEDGTEVSLKRRPAARSVWIYRYYEPASKDLGTGERPEITDYAQGLHRFIEAIRDHYCGTGENPKEKAARAAFRVYLVAHSMGGLIARCYLQTVFPEENKSGEPIPVDKVYTYATPHGGIDLRLIGNVPSFLRVNNIENFNEAHMRKYLSIKTKSTPVNSLDGKFDPSRFFSLVGTNHRDYNMARLAVGPMSDGLVKIKNATVQDSPRAFVHRAHSGDYGIVNSEDGYQILRRFLFGSWRVEGLLEIAEISLPNRIQKLIDKNKSVQYSHHIEVVARVRGARWDLQRRTVGEESARFLSAERLEQAEGRPIPLATAYLMPDARVNRSRDTLGFSVDLGILVPEYEVDGFLFLDDYYDGGYLFRDKLNLELRLPKGGRGPQVRFGWDSERANESAGPWMDPTATDPLEFRIPIDQAGKKPGLRGAVVLRATRW